MADTQNSPAPIPGLAEEVDQWLRSFARQFPDCWERLPNKAFFFTLLAAWSLLFHFFGNFTFGYFHTRSLFVWLYDYYNHNGANYGPGEDAHGNLVPFLVLALFWWKREQLLKIASCVWWPGLLLLAFSALLHLTGFLVQQTRISVVAYFIGVYALIGTAWGPRWLIASFFPFFLFAFSVPISSVIEPVTFALRMFVSQVVGVLSDILGLDVIREGANFYDSKHTFAYEVAAACSGMRSFVAIVAMCTIYGFVSFEKNWKRATIIAAAVPLAVLGNIVRMMCIIIAAHLWGKEKGDYVHESTVLSLIPYIPAIAGILFIGNWLSGERVDSAPTMSPKPA